MKKILLIGCGNIGSRHLQSILKINTNCAVYVVEKSKISTNVAKKRCKEVSKKNSIKSLYFFF